MGKGALAKAKGRGCMYAYNGQKANAGQRQWASCMLKRGRPGCHWAVQSAPSKIDVAAHAVCASMPITSRFDVRWSIRPSPHDGDDGEIRRMTSNVTISMGLPGRQATADVADDGETADGRFADCPP